MKWENLTSQDFSKAVVSTGGVCLLPFGVLEKHGDHLPLGQDMIYIHDIATQAAEREPAIVFPYYYFGQILEAKHVPGTIAVNPELLLPMLQNVCDEIGRNGITKILIINGHGGNINMLRYFLFTQLHREHDYMVFLSDIDVPKPNWDKIKEAKVDGHAGEQETCGMLHLHPELVKLDRYGSYGLPQKRLKHLRDAGISTGIWWYADFPGHFAGDQVPMSAEKGAVMVKDHVDIVVDQIRLIKNDTHATELYQEFHRRAKNPENWYP